LDQSGRRTHRRELADPVIFRKVILPWEIRHLIER
jgi:hypothetical protein